MKSRALVLACVITAGLGAACSKTPTAPTPPPPPPPPVANPPTLTCVEGISRSTVNANGVAVSYDTPPVTDGQGSVSVTCSPSSGETFPIGTTAVTCTATDTLNRNGTCSFNVTVSKLAQLSRVRFLAFGDSITAGEVTAPVGSILNGPGLITRQVIVPSAAYPAVLFRTLTGRYSSQGSSIVVANDSVGGQKVIDARNRYFQALNVVRPEVVLLLMGYNDIARGEDGAASGAANEIRIWAAEARSRGMRVFIATPTPGLAGHGRVIDPFLLVDYANRMRDVAARDGHILVELYNTMLPDAQRYIGIDGLHPNEAGYARIADLFFQAIQTNLEVR